MGGRLRNFIIVGAAKSGTTSLAHWLGAHPQAFVAPRKERDARLVTALLGLVLAPRRPRALLLGVPYAWYRRPRRVHPWELVGTLQAVGYDLAILVGVLRGAVRHRRIVL